MKLKITSAALPKIYLVSISNRQKASKIAISENTTNNKTAKKFLLGIPCKKKNLTGISQTPATNWVSNNEQ